MILTSFGDMAQHVYLRNRSVELRDQLVTLTEELSTGVASNLTEKLGGDLTYLADVERNLSQLDSFEVAASEAALFAEAAQNYLGGINDNLTRLGSDILGMSAAANENASNQLSEQSYLYLTEAVRTLNGQAAGRSLFAGTATTTQPLESADTLMTALAAEVSGLTDVDDIMQAVDDWFADPAGFDAVMYKGSANSMAPVQIGTNEEVSISLRADDDAIKDALKSFAIGALANDTALGLASGAKHDLIRNTAGRLMDASTGIVSTRADLGFIEQRIEETRARNAAALTGFGITHNELVGADPFETATRLEQVQLQLETLFTVTSRSSQLSLVRYL